MTTGLAFIFGRIGAGELGNVADDAGEAVGARAEELGAALRAVAAVLTRIGITAVDERLSTTNNNINKHVTVAPTKAHDSATPR